MTPEIEATEESAVDEDRLGELRDGTPVFVHRVRPRDRAGIEAFVARISEDSIELRFTTPARPEAVSREILGPPGEEGRLSLLMETIEERPRIVANGEYVRYPRDPGRAEVAFLVADDFQGRGASTLLLYDLARWARAAGIRWFTAVVAAENVAMRDVFLRAGFPYRVVCDGPTLLVELDVGEAVGRRADPAGTRIGGIVPFA